jgi:hypothetical protein
MIPKTLTHAREEQSASDFASPTHYQADDMLKGYTLKETPPCAFSTTPTSNCLTYDPRRLSPATASPSPSRSIT